MKDSNRLREAANEHMVMLEKSPARVKSYFQNPGSNMQPVESSYGRINSVRQRTYRYINSCWNQH